MSIIISIMSIFNSATSELIHPAHRHQYHTHWELWKFQNWKRGFTSAGVYWWQNFTRTIHCTHKYYLPALHPAIHPTYTVTDLHSKILDASFLPNILGIFITRDEMDKKKFFSNPCEVRFMRQDLGLFLRQDGGLFLRQDGGLFLKQDWRFIFEVGWRSLLRQNGGLFPRQDGGLFLRQDGGRSPRQGLSMFFEWAKCLVNYEPVFRRSTKAQEQVLYLKDVSQILWLFVCRSWVDL